MSSGKIILIIIIVLAVLLTIGFFWGKSVWSKVSFSAPKLQALDLQGLSLQDLEAIVFTDSTKEVKAGLSMSIKNDNNFAISFGKLKAQLYYNGVLIAETSPALASQVFTVLPNNSLAVTDTVTIVINGAATKQMVLEKAKGGHPKIDYTVKVSVFGIPLPSIKSDFSW